MILIYGMCFIAEINYDFSDRFVIQLLEDLVFFVSDVPNNGQNVLDIVITKANRERQKLMREQNILKQVIYYPEQLLFFAVLNEDY